MIDSLDGKVIVSKNGVTYANSSRGDCGCCLVGRMYLGRCHRCGARIVEQPDVQ